MVQDQSHTDELIAAFANLDGDEERRRFILDHPVMIANSTMRTMAQRPSIAIHYLRVIDVVGGRIATTGEDITMSFNADRYPVGKGPVEKLWNQIEAKQISPAVAIDQAKQPTFSNELTFVYIKALCDHCRHLMETNPIIAFNRQRVVVESTEALATNITSLPDSEVWQMRCAAGHTWIEVTGNYLVGVADPRALMHAAAIGDRLIEECISRKDQDYLPRLLQRMGVLYLDPYTAGRDLVNEQNYRFAIRNWVVQLRAFLGPEYANLKQAERDMPDPVEALTKAERYLRDAARLSSGRDKAYTIAALVQGLAALRLVGGTVDKAGTAALIDEALGLLTPGIDDERIIRLTNARARLIADDEPDASANMGVLDIIGQIKTFLHDSINSIEQKLGPQATFDAVNQLLSTLTSREENATGLRIVERFRGLFDKPGAREESRAALWRREVRLLRGWYAGRHGTYEPELYSRPVEKGPIRIGGTAASKFRTSEIDKRIGELLSTALNGGEGDQEEKGLAAIAEAVQLDATLFRQNYDALTYLQALLALGAGTNAFNGKNAFGARDLSQAVSRYISALAMFLRLDQASKVHVCLEYLEDIVKEFSDPAAAFRLVRNLGYLANDIEVNAGTAGAERLQSIYREASSLWLTQSGEAAIDAETVFLFFRLAKGCRFSRCMRAKARYDWRKDPEALRQIDVIKNAKKALGIGSEDMPARDFRDPELLLTGRSGIHELLPGTNAEEQFENLRLAFDDYLSRIAAAKGIGKLQDRWAELFVGALPGLVTIGDIQSAIDRQTVVVDYYLGQDCRRQPMLYALCLTNDDAALFGIPVGHLPSGEVVLSEGGPTIHLPPIKRLTYEIRTGVNTTPGFSEVAAPHVEPALQEGMQVLFGTIAEFLQANRDKGRGHLCIVPHEALHFMPFHLLGPVGSAIGATWTITYLAVIELLMEKSEDLTAPGCSATSVGLDFKQENPARLPTLERAPVSAQEVAVILGGQALINSDATETRVVTALPASRYFHLFTHGQQCVYAAAFHAVYLLPDVNGETDGVLEAYELLPLGLRGIDVLTLAACETALGRFDIGDNVMGLPGCLLFAGVKTIIGTLWPVSAPVAERFFGKFYAEISRQKSKLSAFQSAQASARTDFPEYRDWGAFYFTGQW